MSEGDVPITIAHLHPISSVGERLYDHILILISPFAHPGVRVDDRANIVDNILLLSSLVVKRYLTGRQGLQSSSDVDLGAAGDT